MGEQNLPGLSDMAAGAITFGIVVVIYILIRILQKRPR
jgi:hypothetical protein